MTEKEKMIAGDFYNTRDGELIEMYHKARKLIDDFNKTTSYEMDEKQSILKKLLGSIENGVWIEKPFYCDYGENISIGENTFINFNCTFLDCNKITVGENVLIGPNVQIYTASHPLRPMERINKDISNGEAPYKTFSRPVKIGNNVWIGGNVTILPGVEIGDNSVIGASSVVTKSIPSNSIAYGNPCRVEKTV
ncbi:maltose O-acetyltransferase [Clostridium cavendishii DSM 21758]|uniref:Acetyltransferase n=1 Tax=Clostridium cavendishii DSM 21758 TaxID=1121302 RepID=A0A1M6I9K6_9CLOT|nr:sugar O-acetyltransferase [Clostridium cavendishii]SHJ31137.1 maltose O-acetyltransferase [Clostridium cavendishii DSM 21758]